MLDDKVDSFLGSIEVQTETNKGHDRCTISNILNAQGHENLAKILKELWYGNFININN